MKKTIKKRAFVSAIAMLIVSAIVLTSSTFAWFSMSKEAKIESMDLTVSSPAGIQISANASTWTANLTLDELFDSKSTSRYKAYDGNTNLMPADLIPVSSAFRNFNSTTGNAEFYKATLNDAKKATIEKVNQISTNASNCGFVAFDLFFKVAEDTTVYFGTSEFTDNSNSDILTALRVGFQPMGNTDSSTDASDAIAMKGTMAAINTMIYEVDSQNRSGDSESAGNSTGTITTQYIVSESATGTANTNYVLNNSYTASYTGKLILDTAAATAKSFSLKAGISKMRIYIWVEGNDVDCRNSVAGAALSVALKFTIN